MVIQYIESDKELVVGGSLLPCAIKLDLLAESICISPLKVETDDHECTIFDTENNVIYWAIPEISSSDINALLSRVAPLAETIIFHTKQDANYTEIPLKYSVEIELTKITNCVNDQEILRPSI